MKVVLQRVTEGSVDVDGTTVGAIGAGIVLLVGIEARDTLDDVKWIAPKIWNMRLWDDEANGKSWSESAGTRKYEILVISQFTLQARLKGNRPDFRLAQEPSKAEVIFKLLVAELNRIKPEGCKNVATGQFGAKMAVKLTNDGPVTINLDSQAVKFPRKIKPATPTTGGARVDAASQEVDVPWVAPTGSKEQADIIPLELDADGMIAPPENVLPEGTPMTTMMYAIPEGYAMGDTPEVPLPSGMSVKVKIPDGKGTGDVLQIQIPEALMSPDFKRQQEEARRMQEQGMAIIDFKVPEGKSPGDTCAIQLPSGITVRVNIPEGMGAGDILKVRVAKAALEEKTQRVDVAIPEGKKSGDEFQVRLASGQTISIKVPEGKVPGDKISVNVPARLNQVMVPPGTPMEQIKWTIPEGKGPGDTVKLQLPSGMAFQITIPPDKKAGDVIERKVPKPFLDPKFREKQALAQQRQEAMAKQPKTPAGLTPIEEELIQTSRRPQQRKNKKKKKKKKK